MLAQRAVADSPRWTRARRNRPGRLWGMIGKIGTLSENRRLRSAADLSISALRMPSARLTRPGRERKFSHILVAPPSTNPRRLLPLRTAGYLETC